MSYYEPSSLYALQEEKNYLESLGDGDSGVERDWWGLYKTCQVRRERRHVASQEERHRIYHDQRGAMDVDH